MAKEVKCPWCGLRVLESALEAHKRVMCPNKSAGGPAQPKPEPEPARVDVVAAPAHNSVDDLLEQLAPAAMPTAPKPEEAKSMSSPAPAPPTDSVKRHVYQSENPIPIPPAESHFWVSEAHRAVMERVATLASEGVSSNVMLMGPAGCGKTTLPRHFAAMYGRPFYEIHCGAMMDVEQWFGKDRLLGGETLYRKSRFVQAIETPQSVILLDEINRAHPELLNGIFGLLDWRRSIYSDDLGYMVRVAEGVTFFATLNEGMDYFGVNPLDSALRDRFPRVLRLSYPPVEQEESILVALGVDIDTAGRLARFAKQLRNATVPVAVSPRQLQTVAEEVRLGASLREAVELSIVNKLDDPQLEKQALEALQLVDPNPYVDRDQQEQTGRFRGGANG